ncbi:P-loop containing nucleoside triphosphate hydrolase protein, partial [Dichomitus squalens LYAD-421 SS1]
MNIDPSTSFYLNLGNDRPNITWEVRYMKAGRPELDELEFLLPTLPNSSRLTKTMVFFDDITASMKARRWFQKRLPAALYPRVRCYNARRGELSKGLVMSQFLKGDIDILLATEAAGMGCDIPDVAKVVQFKAPNSLSTWLQRAGRAGRSASIQARAVLLIQ